MDETKKPIHLAKMEVGYVNRADCCRNCVRFVKTHNVGTPNCNLLRWPTQPEAICKRHERRKESRND